MSATKIQPKLLSRVQSSSKADHENTCVVKSLIWRPRNGASAFRCFKSWIYGTESSLMCWKMEKSALERQIGSAVKCGGTASDNELKYDHSNIQAAWGRTFTDWRTPPAGLTVYPEVGFFLGGGWLCSNHRQIQYILLTGLLKLAGKCSSVHEIQTTLIAKKLHYLVNEAQQNLAWYLGLGPACVEDVLGVLDISELCFLDRWLHGVGNYHFLVMETASIQCIWNGADRWT